MKAIIFDFFGTLTDPSAEAGRRASAGATAAALGVRAEDFWGAMSGSFGERIVGRYGGTEATLRTMARRCGADPSDEALATAVAAHRAAAERVRTPRPGALDLLDRLRGQGYRLGLISDCSSELVEAWPDTPYAARLDATVFSWREGRRKPGPRLYATAAERLDVAEQECWFVGDGGSREHDGARRAGMRPVLVTNAAYPDAGAFRSDPDTYLPDLAIPDLSDLPAIIRPLRHNQASFGD